MKIVVLDGFTLNPGDLSWDALAALGEVEIHERTGPDELRERAAGAEILLTNKTPLDAEAFAALPELRFVGVLATGVNVVDLDAAARHDVLVANVPAYSTASVAQMTFALLLELCHRVQRHSDAVKSGVWSACEDFCFWHHPLVELEGRTMGLVGFGRIGRRVARIADSFGLRVIATSRSRSDPPPWDGFAFRPLDDLLAEADIVSLHCPLTPETEGLMDAARIARMRNEAFLLNTARGGLLVDEDLAAALNGGRLAGAGLDVLSLREPPEADNPLLAAKNCIITPHIAWATRAARERLLETMVGNVEAFLRGEPRNVVNG